MHTALELSSAVVAHGPYGGPGFGWIAFILIPLFWLGVIALIATLVGRRRRAAWAAAGGPPWAAWHGAQAARGAESTLAERFAQGDIDEQEYRARLEVLRANSPQPPAGR